MPRLQQLLDNNQNWAEEIIKEDPDFFLRSSKAQYPRYLWIGCSDSRVPAEQLTGLKAGDLFVHRNIANQVIHTDINCLSVIQYAVDVLKVKDVIVCGHSGCGGIYTAIDMPKIGLINNWLLHIRDIYIKYRTIIGLLDKKLHADLLCEINVIEQVYNLGNSTILQSAWSEGRKVQVHGYFYDTQTGLINDLNISVDSAESLQIAYQAAQSAITSRVHALQKHLLEKAEKAQQQELLTEMPDTVSVSNEAIESHVYSK